MNAKRLLLLAGFAAIVTIAMPAAFAATLTNTITVKWNTQAVTAFTVVTDYSNSSGTALQGTATPTYLADLNSGSGNSCGGASTAETAQTANFQNITPDNTTKYTDCLYPNGADAHVVTSDAAGYSVAVAGTLPDSCGSANCSTGAYILCLLPNGTWANNGVVTVSTRTNPAPEIDGTHACSTQTGAINLNSGTIFSGSSTTSGSDFGGDIELAVPALASSGAQSVTITYTLTTN